MGKSLVIVESPAKAKTINKYLGKDYVVKSSVGHIRDLPTSGSGNEQTSKPFVGGVSVRRGRIELYGVQRWRETGRRPTQR